MVENKKTNMFLVLKTLEEHTDSDHYLLMNVLTKKIEDDYNISLDRKTISDSVDRLIELGYDIDKRPRKGVALVSRYFDKNEISFLIDAVFSSKAIPSKEADELTKKLRNTLSIHERQNYRYIFRSNEIARTNNREVFYNIEIINEAIEKNLNIKFKILTYDDNGNLTTRFNGYEYQVSPYYLINNFGRYYLLGYRRRYEGTDIYRVDNMVDVKIDETRIRKPLNEIEPYKNGFSISTYINEHVYMFGGKSVETLIQLEKGYVIAFVKDWFGENANIFVEDGNIYAKIKCNENAFFYWAMQYAEHIKIIKPQSLIEKVKKASKAIFEKYSDEE